MKSVRFVCAHDCPDTCSLIARVEDGRVVGIQGDPEHPFTAGFACAKVNRDMEQVHSPDRVPQLLSRTGRKGFGEFVPVSWDVSGSARSYRCRRQSERCLWNSSHVN